MAMIKKVGVIGAGQMGSGIAHVCSLAGFDVKLLDANPEMLPKSLSNIGANMDRQIKRGQITPDAKAAALKRISTGTDYGAFKDCDLVIEAATENEAVKREVMEETAITIEPVALAGFRETITRDADNRVERHFVILPFAARWLAGEPCLNEELSEARWVRPAALADLPTTPGLAAIVANAFERLEQPG